MSFGAPGYLAFLAVAALAGAALVRWAVWRGSALRRFGSPFATAARIAYIAPALLLAAAGAAAFAAARPQAGATEVTVEDRGIDLMIVLDVSKSMFADDIAPTRLGRAQSEIGALLDRMTGDRAGLVIFAGEPFARSPLTSDLTALRAIVEGVDEERGLVPPGSDLGAAIERAHEALLTGLADTNVLLIVSDGEDHGGGIAPAVAAARAAGIAVYTGGAGTAAGSPVVDVDPQTGDIRPRVDASGAPVMTRLDAAALSAVAGGGGRYIELSGEGRPLAALATEFESLASTTFATEETATPVERFQIVALAALVLAVAATAASSVRHPYIRTPLRLWPLAGASLFIAGVCAADAADVNRRGNRHYDAGEYTESIVAYRTAQALDPSKGELYHNAGNALDRGGEYASAIDETKRALPANVDSLEAIIEYALGNHYVGAQRFGEALEAYRRALLADPADTDAKHNFELTSRRLTPTAIPRAPTSSLPELPSTPDEGDPGEGNGTPSPAGTPQSGGTPQPGDPGDIPPEQLERLLAEALAGIDEEFTAEEAIRVLELLEERNRDQLGNSAPGGSELADY